jgi:hypothetical protein
MSVRAAGRAGRLYPGELGCTGVNCHPNCNPGPWLVLIFSASPLGHSWIVPASGGIVRIKVYCAVHG